MQIERVKYQVIESHSGTNQKEINAAKRRFRRLMNNGQVHGLIYNQTVVIRFEDVNNQITAHYENLNGEEIA